MMTRSPAATPAYSRRRARSGIEWVVAAAAILFAAGVVARMAQPKLFRNRPFTGRWTCVDDPKTTFEFDRDGTYCVVTTGGDVGGLWIEQKPAGNQRGGMLTLRDDEDCPLPCYSASAPVSWALRPDGAVLTLRRGGAVWLRGRRELCTSP